MDYYSDLFIIPASISSPNLSEFASVDFIIDTGSSRTTINDKDVSRLQINYNDLKPSAEQYYGVGGTNVKSYELLDCKLLFIDDDNNERLEELKCVLVNQHDFKSENEKKMMMQFQSLLGLDILKKYRIRFSNYTAFLED